MEQHVRTLAHLYIFVGVFGGLAALILLISFGGFNGIMLATDRADFASGPLVQVMRFFGSGLTLMMLVLAVPTVAVGMGLLRLRTWARSLGMVISTLQLANFPVGTAVAVYGFWVLMSQETDPLFDQPPPSGS